MIGGRIGNKYLSDCYEIIRKPSMSGQSVVNKSSSMNESRAKFGCVFYKGYLYVFGGKTDNILLSSSERYNISKDKW